MILQNENYKLDVNINETKDYYKSNEICDCLPCQNYYAQVKENFKVVDKFLSELGVNIFRPDSTSWIEDGNMIKYLDITYTICGKILEKSGYNFIINDSKSIPIMITNKFVPNNHKNKNWFCVSISDITLPFIIFKD